MNFKAVKGGNGRQHLKMVEKPIESTYGDAVLYVVGYNFFINEVLINLLAKEEGYHCQACEDLEHLTQSLEANKDLSVKLILLDCQSFSLKSLFSALTNEPNTWEDTYKIAVFNVPADSDIGVRILGFGGHGVFYQKDSSDSFLKGIQSILEGELWVSRDITYKYIQESRRRKKENKDGVLTKREKEILLCLPSGITNEDIAETLCISPHTVRTHLSNIYNKLNVSNRFQAALWATENIL